MFSQAGSVDKILPRQGSQVGAGGSGVHPGGCSRDWADRLQNLSAGAIATRDRCAANAGTFALRGGVHTGPRVYPGCRPIDGTFVRRLNTRSSATPRLEREQSLFPGRVPMFAPAYMGRKRILQMHSLYAQGLLLWPQLPGCSRALEGAAPRLFRPMYAGANMRHPSRTKDLGERSKSAGFDLTPLRCQIES